jgi:hypothetical protein
MATVIIETYEQFIGPTTGTITGPTELGLPLGVTFFKIATHFGPSAPLPQFLMSLETQVQCSAVGGNALTTCNATSDYFDTVRITSAQVFDSSGNLVQGATITSDTGFNPNATPSVPEPSSLLLLGSGLLYLIVLRRKQRG